MKKYVLDSFALIAYLEGEECGKSVISIFEEVLEGKAEIFLSVINWGEIYYIALREGGEERAELYRMTISKYPVAIVEANKELTLAAAKFKAHHKMSYADAFAAGLTKHKSATLLTGDKEFKPIEKEIKIEWI
jgi:uncharacterized protein